MATLEPEDLNLSALPRNRFGHLKEDAAAELLQRAAWNYRKVLAEKQRLTRTAEELKQRVDELTEEVASLEARAARQREPDELARVLLGAAQRTARAEREAARRDCESMLHKATQRAKRVEEDVARRAAEVARSEALGEEIIAVARKRAATITAEAEAEAAAILERAAVLGETSEREAAAVREELEREVAAATRELAEELSTAQAQADTALVDAQRELARLEAEAAMLRSLRTDAARQVVEIAQRTIEGLDSLGARGGAAGELFDEAGEGISSGSSGGGRIRTSVG